MSWINLQSVKQVVENYPFQIERLFNALDFRRDDMQKVKSAWKQDDKVSACELLLEFYQNSNQAEWYRNTEIQDSERIIQHANDVLNDIYSSPHETGKVPRKDNGHLDWTYQGANTDWQFSLALNRHNHLLELYFAWKLTGEVNYIKRIDQDLRDWLVAANGNAAAFKTSHLEPGLRMQIWAKLFYALQQESSFRKATRILLLAAIPVHGDYLVEHPGFHNWVSMTQLGALYAGICWPQFIKAEQWKNKSLHNLTANINDCVYPDGVQKELSSTYHMVSLTRYQNMIELLRNAGLKYSENIDSIIKSMWAYLAESISPSGKIPHNNDSDFCNRTGEIRAMAKRYNMPTWFYMASQGKEGIKPTDPPSRVFPWAGQLISRDGWDLKSQWSFFDFGPSGTNHMHHDHGHLSIQIGGHDILVDSGRFAYSGKIANAFNSYGVMTHGHNTILIDGQGQGVLPQSVTRPAQAGDNYIIHSDFDYARAVWEDYPDVEGKVIHRRAILYLRGQGWIVVDRVETDRPREIEALWHFHPTYPVIIEDQVVITKASDAPNVFIRPLGSIIWSAYIIRGQMKPQPQGWYSERYNSVEKATCIRYKTTISKTMTFGWMIWPSTSDSWNINPLGFDSVTGKIPVVMLTQPDGTQIKLTVPIIHGIAKVKKESQGIPCGLLG